MTTLDIANLLLNRESSACIPVARDKRPLLSSWAKYRTELPSSADYAKWFANGAAIAVVAGRVQCLDVDTKHADPGLWDRLLKRFEDVGLASLVERVLIQRTPSGGYHMVWICDSELRNVKLAENPKREVILETRGTGGYFLIHPSPGYRVVQGAWDSLPTLTQDERDDLLAVARSFNESQPKEVRPTVTPGTETTPGDDYDARADVPALLLKYGWERTDASGHYWRRPGKDSGMSASWNVIPNRFWVWTTSTAFEAQHVYRPWHVFAVLECDANFTAAAKRLAALGYGAPRQAERGAASPHTPPASPSAPGGSTAVLQPQPVLPPILAVEIEEAQDWPRPPELVSGVLYRGAKGMIAGPSKSRKTFALTDLAVSVAAGVPWLGFATVQTPVLYVNLELQGFAFRDRRREIARAKLAATVTGLPLWSWHLRGYGVTLPLIRSTLLAHCSQHDVGLIILDPTYKLNQQGQENATEDVGRLLNEFEQVAREAEAAVVFCHHFAKGTAADKAAIDRASGSGVWARDPDAILTFSPHEEDDAMIIEMSLRNFRHQEPFVVRWNYPVWERDPNADPTAHHRPLRPSKAGGGKESGRAANPPYRPRKVTDEQVKAFTLALYPDGPDGRPAYRTQAAAIKAASEMWRVSERTAERRMYEWAAGQKTD